MSDYSGHYTEAGFWAVLEKIDGIGHIVSLARRLYRFIKDPDDAPEWAIALVIAALGYLIFPLDVIPDLIPVLGYGDDAGVLAAAASQVAKYLPSE